jgi:DNA adenine methylase
MYYSPLRYPGGKARLAPFMELMMKKQGHDGGVYIEPFAGGAGIAIELLEKNVASKIVINDYDKGIYSFWRAILEDTNRFIEDIEHIPLTVDEWEKQHTICMHNNDRYSYELGFATFYMNRTNRSGIIKGGIIGGRCQTGNWKMDARFNREHLIDRIQKIAKRKRDINIYNKDVRTFITNYMPKYCDNSLTYFDPPYFQKGKQLYLNFFDLQDHKEIKSLIERQVNCDWIITYDDSKEIEKLYGDNDLFKFDLDYSASSRRKASELMIFKNSVKVPTSKELMEESIQINLRKC